MTFHCLFEQSGTFKKEFVKLGHKAFDYDILNDFGETDFVIDLYSEIEKAYGGGLSMFDKISSDDTILAFFPCIRFEDQIIMSFTGVASQMKNWDDIKKLEYALNLHEDLAVNYRVVAKLVLVCLKKNLKLIIENPYSTQHYLQRYFPIKPKLIDKNRRDRGDYYEKPTQYWFINCEPKNNFIFECQVIAPIKKISDVHNKVERSLISPDYANRFIREFILEQKEE